MLEFDYKSIPLRQEKSIPDPRDWHISRLIPPSQTTVVFPDEFELPYNYPIKNQGAVSSCVAHSLAYCREIGEEQQLGKYTQLSVGFVYACRKIGSYQGVGMMPQDALQELVDFGICDYTSFPVNEEYPAILNDFNPIKDSLILNATPHKITGYAAVKTSDDIKNALITLKNPVTIEIPVWSSFYSINSQNSTIPIPDTTKETLAGYHETTITGYKQGLFKILNSWGNSWGDNGYFWMGADFLPLVVVMYSMTDGDIQPEPQPNPTPITHDYKLTTTFQSSMVNDGANNNVTISTMDGLTPVINQNVSIQVKRSGQIYTPNIADNNGVIIIAFQSSTEEEIEVNTTWVSPDNISHTASATATWKNPNPQPIPTPSLVSINVDPLTLTLTVGTFSPISIIAKYSDNTASVITGLSTFVFSNANVSFNNGNINGLVAGNCLVTISYKGMNTVLNVVVVDAPKPIPDNNKLYHVQTIPINSTKTAEIQKQQEELKALGYNVYSTISSQIVASSTEASAKVNSDKLTAKGIANVILYY